MANLSPLASSHAYHVTFLHLCLINLVTAFKVEES